MRPGSRPRWPTWRRTSSAPADPGGPAGPATALAPDAPRGTPRAAGTGAVARRTARLPGGRPAHLRPGSVHGPARPGAASFRAASFRAVDRSASAMHTQVGLSCAALRARRGLCGPRHPSTRTSRGHGPGPSPAPGPASCPAAPSSSWPPLPATSALRGDGVPRPVTPVPASGRPVPSVLDEVLDHLRRPDADLQHPHGVRAGDQRGPVRHPELPQQTGHVVLDALPAQMQS